MARAARIKILYTIPNFDTAGSGKALLQLAMRLDPKKFEVHIACMHSRGSFFRTVEATGIPVHIISYTTDIKPYVQGLKACFKISKQFKAIAPDVIHSFHYAADYSEPLAAKFAGIPWVYTKKNMSWGGGSKNAWYLRSYLARAIAIQNTDMQSAFFEGSKKTVLIPRGVDTQFYHPKEAQMDLKKEWGLQETQKVVMCVANLVPVKGIAVLLEAFKIARKTHSNWKLMLVGDCDNSYGKEMQLFAKQLDLEKHVLFCGKQSEVVDYLSIADLVVLPTLDEGRREGCPVSLLEAMSCAKMVLGSNIPGIRDQLRKFPNHLVEAGNVTAWSNALEEQFININSSLMDQGALFRTHVIENYGIEKEVANTEALYVKYI